jgi:hypothetical protein
MKTLQEEYLEKISSQVFVRANASDIEQALFVRRWLPQNFDLKNAEVVELVGDGASNEHIKRVGEKLKKTFEEEILSDGFDLEKMEGQERFPLTFRWLWEHKFPREAWDFMQEIAFPLPIPKTDVRGYKRPKYIENSRVKVGESCLIPFQFERDGFLYLINDSTEGDKSLFAPSRLFAHFPVTKVVANQSLQFPLTEDHFSLSFEDEGEEFFLAIITKNHLDLSWVHERADDDLDLNFERLSELFRKVASDPHSQVFYKKLTIIPPSFF